MAIYMNRVLQPSEPGTQRYTSAAGAMQFVRSACLRGPDQILVCQAATPFVRVLAAEKGIIAILIGLLLPAVQKLHDGSSPDLAVFRAALAPGGRMGVVLADGSVRQLGGGSGPLTGLAQTAKATFG